ncbi:MAG: primosomal protein N' [Candidatus Sumerlaeia bacterium]|nr:primosomal protein N' [Candidatus Sumerlaeia bacterium]
MTPPSGAVAVAVNRPHLDPLTYLVPEGAPAPPPGSMVEVRLGAAGAAGVVLGPAEPPPGVALRAYERRLSEGFAIPPDVVRLAEWIAGYYCCSLGEALASASFLGMADEPPRPPRGVAAAPDPQRAACLASKPAKAAAAKLEAGGWWPSRAEAARALGATAGAVKALAEAGLLAPADAPFTPRTPPPALALNDEQRHALAAITAPLREGRFEALLLHGITGSGKTEVYLQAIREALALGGTAICLVPEISLTPQTVERFEERLGIRIGVCHSRMERREKRALYDLIAAGAVRVVIGARSAVFTPLPDLRLLVVDEEHEGSYKQGEAPRYHARDAAVVRAAQGGFPVVLGSATPSMESYENARTGKYRLLPLTARATAASLPKVEIVDLAAAARDAGAAAPLISKRLADAIAKRLEAGEQSLLLLNKRGFSSFLLCPGCKWVARCGEDDVALTIHRPGAARAPLEEREPDLFEPPARTPGDHLRCHFCGKREPIPALCPKCGREGLMAVGSGTQRAETELAALFPGRRILRLDLDTVGGKYAFADAWRAMVSGEAEIILGTQMIAKGLHLERVTLVGVVLADIGLFIPDFRADERAFSLLCQVAGRAGRRHPGEVLIQTFMPSHPVIQFAKEHDYTGFFQRERARRALLRFPPEERLAAVTVSDQDLERASEWARRLAALMRSLLAAGEFPGAAVRGPLPAPLAKLANRWRQRILIRSQKPGAAAALCRRAFALRDWKPPASLRAAVDIDPADLM